MPAAHERGAWWLALGALLTGGGVLYGLLRAPPPELPAPPPEWAQLAPPSGTPLRAWRWIVLHHSATRGGSTAAIDAEHQQARGWEGVGYHFVVGNGRGMRRGRIDATFRWRNQQPGAHAGGAAPQRPYNQGGIGICLIGDYAGEAAPADLERRVAELCVLLCRRIPTLAPERILGHGSVPGKVTGCPGRLDVARIRALVAEALAAPPGAPAAR